MITQLGSWLTVFEGYTRWLSCYVLAVIMGRNGPIDQQYLLATIHWVEMYNFDTVIFVGNLVLKYMHVYML